LGRFPQVSAFIENHSKTFTNLKVKYTKGAPPRIKLYGEGDFLEEEVNIENWDTDTIVQFLDEKLTH